MNVILSNIIYINDIIAIDINTLFFIKIYAIGK